MKYLDKKTRQENKNREFGEKFEAIYKSSQPRYFVQEKETETLNFKDSISVIEFMADSLEDNEVLSYIKKGTENNFFKSANAVVSLDIDAETRRRNLLNIVKKAVHNTKHLTSYELQMVSRLGQQLTEAAQNQYNRINSSFIDNAEKFFVYNEQIPGTQMFVPKLTQAYKKSVLLDTIEELVWSESGYFLDKTPQNVELISKGVLDNVLKMFSINRSSVAPNSFPPNRPTAAPQHENKGYPVVTSNPASLDHPTWPSEPEADKLDAAQRQYQEHKPFLNKAIRFFLKLPLTIT